MEFTDLTDTQTDTQTDNDIKQTKNKKAPIKINEALKEKIRKELTGPSKFDDPEVRKALERRAMRYSIAVSSTGGQPRIELGTSVQSTMARNLPNDVFSDKSKQSEEYLEMLRERRRSRAQLATAHSLVQQTLQVRPGDPNCTVLSEPPAEHSDQLESPPPASRSMPEFQHMAYLMDNSEDDEPDVISKLVGRSALLTTPVSSRNRKVSLQEELCGKSAPAAKARPLRTSIAGDIIAETSNEPTGGFPNLPGLIIPDKWKQDFSEKIIAKREDRDIAR